MCIIIIKNKGVEVPTKQVLKNCFINNNDGAGYMYVGYNGVQIEKGFMRFKSLWKSLRSKSFGIDDIIVYHFRLGTHGYINGHQTHPFPLSSKEKHLKKLHTVCDIAVAHNGIINISASKNKEHLSDTMVFIMELLSHDDIRSSIFSSASVLKLIEHSTQSSKLVFLNQTGETRTTGTWVTDYNGLLFSNNTYKVEKKFEFYKKHSYKDNYKDTSNYYLNNYYSGYNMEDYDYGYNTIHDNNNDDLVECKQCYQDTFDRETGICYSCNYDQNQDNTLDLQSIDNIDIDDDIGNNK